MRKRNRMIRIGLATVLILSALFASGCSKPDVIPPDVIPPEGADGNRTAETQASENLIFPLTGEQASDPEAVSRRPLSVKIENTPETRPQSGVGIADVVYESVTEGGITRFNCIFHSTVPDEVGPVRSARNSDLSVVPEYDALFFFSGANDYVYADIAATRLPIMSEDAVPDMYYRYPGKSAPHNLWLKIGSAYDRAYDLGYGTAASDAVRLNFGASEHAAATPASSFSIPWGGVFNVEWTWDDGQSVWLRSQQNNPFTDAITGEQVGAANVVILWADYITAEDIPGKGQTFNVNLKGSGTAAVFRGGQRIDGKWTSDGTSPPRFVDASGAEILLNPGQTWFEVPQTSLDIQVAIPIPSSGGTEGEGNA
ncbi:hypothetical protein AGMMS49983_08240 [Clostridia bacterium]|nr:hypothetical protein AGMMS49983_08240 [Clostridia bacterium]